MIREQISDPFDFKFGLDEIPLRDGTVKGKKITLFFDGGRLEGKVKKGGAQIQATLIPDTGRTERFTCKPSWMGICSPACTSVMPTRTLRVSGRGQRQTPCWSAWIQAGPCLSCSGCQCLRVSTMSSSTSSTRWISIPPRAVLPTI